MQSRAGAAPAVDARSHLILLTGGTGRIGAHVLDTLRARGYRVRAHTSGVP